MAALYNAGLKPLGSNPTQPYQHATKLFLADNFRLTPKQSFLYYVVINFDPALTQAQGILANIVSFAERYQFFETGMLVKRADLPKFQINTKTLNAYNRKNILHTQLSYEPVSIAFHDDAADVITNFWNDYYTYYFRDSDYDAVSYRHTNRYSLRSKIGWGFSPRNQSLPPLLSNIRIFSLHNKRFTEYMLVNPVITSWRHGEVDSSEGTGLLTNTMQVNYETVKYFTGYVDPVAVDGFTLLHYDNRPSPLATSTSNLYSNSGILGVIDGVAKDLRKPDGANGAGGPLSNLLTLYKTYNNLKGVNFKNAVGASLGQLGLGVANQVLNGRNPFAFPTTASTTTSQLFSNPAPVGNRGIPAVTGVNGGSLVIGAAAGAGINSGPNVLTQGLAAVNRGLQTAIGAGANFVRTGSIFDAQQTSGRVVVDPSTLNTPTGTITGVFIDDNGQAVPGFTTLGTKSGTYNPKNPTENLVSVQTTADEEGNTVVINTYKDGTQVTEDAEGNRLGVFPGKVQNANNINTNPVDTRTLAATGATLSQTGVQYRTDPKTGLVYTVGGTTTAQITNTLSGTAGAVGGLVAGQSINRALNRSFLGDSVIGRTVSAAVSTATGAAIGRAVNNGLQPIINTATGAIVQGWDKVAGEVKNVVGSWTGTGGYSASEPWKNVVGTIEDTDPITGEVFAVTTYKDGTQVTENANGEIVATVKGSNNSGFLNFFNKSPGQNTDSVASGPGAGSLLTDGSGNPIYTGSGDEWNYSGPTEDPMGNPADWVNEGPSNDSWSEWNEWGSE
jgi:hypothetical protein